LSNFDANARRIFCKFERVGFDSNFSKRAFARLRYRRGRHGYRRDNTRPSNGVTGNRNFTMRGECLPALSRNEASAVPIGPPRAPL
jgi:hypothetical protein